MGILQFWKWDSLPKSEWTVSPSLAFVSVANFQSRWLALSGMANAGMDINTSLALFNWLPSTWLRTHYHHLFSYSQSRIDSFVFPLYTETGVRYLQEWLLEFIQPSCDVYRYNTVTLTHVGNDTQVADGEICIPLHMVLMVSEVRLKAHLTSNENYFPKTYMQLGMIESVPRTGKPSKAARVHSMDSMY